MERKENKKFIAVVKDPWKGSYAYRGVESEKGALKNVESLKEKGVPERNISLVPVKEAKSDTLGKILTGLGIICTFIDLAMYIQKEIKARKKKKDVGDKV